MITLDEIYIELKKLQSDLQSRKINPNQIAIVNGLSDISTNLGCVAINGLPLSGSNTGDQVGDGVSITGDGTATNPFVATPQDFLRRTFIPPTLSEYAWVNQDTATASQEASYVKMIKPADAANEIHLLKKALPYEDNFMITIGMTSSGQYVYHRWGIALRDSNSGKVIGCNFMAEDALVKACDHHWTDETTWDASLVQETTIGYPMFLRLIDDGTDYTFQWSNDCINFTTYWTEAKGDEYLDPADEFGFFVETENATFGIGICIFHFQIESLS